MRQCLALSGVAQSAYMVMQLATHGMVGQDKLNTLVRSLFIMNPATTADVYGSVSRMNQGMQVLQEISRNEKDSLNTPEVMRYFLGILHLERKLAQQPEMLEEIGASLDRLQHAPLDDPDLANPGLLRELASLYQQTLSTLAFRIQVTGNVQFLKNEDVADKIRTVLLCGVRSAVLWQQSGGRRWQLLFSRGKIRQALTELLNKTRNIH